MYTAAAHRDGFCEQQGFLLSEFNFQNIGCLLEFRDAAQEMQLTSSCALRRGELREESAEGTRLRNSLGSAGGTCPGCCGGPGRGSWGTLGH